MGARLKRIPKWAWVVAALVAIGVFIYFKRKGAASPTAQPSATDTLASPDTTASIGGQPAATDPGAAFSAAGQDLLDQLAAMQDSFFSQLAGAYPVYTSAGMTPTYTDTYTTTQSSPTAPSAPSPAPTPTPQDLANSFYAPGTMPSGGSAPLYAYSSGQEIAESPIAGSAFSLSQPASVGYETLGIHPSQPITLLPSQPTGGETVSALQSAGQKTKVFAA